jgi:phage baseplate assembly protein W
MSSIVITELNKFPKGRDYTYKDLEMDLKIDYTKTSPLNNFKEQKDIIVDYDVNAIKNSIFNIFTTIPGQKLLNPPFGLNLLYYLFTGITTENAKMLGDTILKGITKFEPRVSVDNINITTDYDNQQYIIDLFLSVPSLNIKGLQVKGTLAESGYYFN